MHHPIKTTDDLRWLMAHTGGFRSGYVTDIQMSKRRLFDEETGRDVLADTTVALTIRYQVRGMVRVAKLVMRGITDFSIFEQEGADCSSLSLIQAEHTAGRFRFWFDPQGELYAVCEEAMFEEVSAPLLPVQPLPELARWTFQGQTSDGPTVSWLLAELEQAGIPCAWVAAKKRRVNGSLLKWEGDLMPDGEGERSPTCAVRVMVYDALEGTGFGIVLRAMGEHDRQASRVLMILADRITQEYSGTCLVGTTMIPGREWEYWRARQGRRLN